MTASWPALLRFTRSLCCPAALSALLLSLQAVAATPSTLTAQLPVTIAPHRAIYDLSLARTSADGPFIGASGTMTFVISDVCSAWSTQQHMELDLFPRIGEVLHSVADDSSLESRDGRHFTFASTTVTNGQTDSIIRGEAVLAPDGSGAATYTLPEKKTVPLKAGTLFPVAQNIAILEAAGRGETGLSRPVFDGTTPDGAEDSYATLLGQAVPGTPPPFAPLSGLPATRFHLATYAAGSDDRSPDFELAARMFTNGVSDEIGMTFSGTRVQATLRSLEMRPAAAHCARRP